MGWAPGSVSSAVLQTFELPFPPRDGAVLCFLRETARSFVSSARWRGPCPPRDGAVQPLPTTALSSARRRGPLFLFSVLWIFIRARA